MEKIPKNSVKDKIEFISETKNLTSSSWHSTYSDENKNIISNKVHIAPSLHNNNFHSHHIHPHHHHKEKTTALNTEMKNEPVDESKMVTKVLTTTTSPKTMIPESKDQLVFVARVKVPLQSLPDENISEDLQKTMTDIDSPLNKIKIFKLNTARVIRFDSGKSRHFVIVKLVVRVKDSKIGCNELKFPIIQSFRELSLTSIFDNSIDAKIINCDDKYTLSKLTPSKKATTESTTVSNEFEEYWETTILPEEYLAESSSMSEEITTSEKPNTINAEKPTYMPSTIDNFSSILPNNKTDELGNFVGENEFANLTKIQDLESTTSENITFNMTSNETSYEIETTHEPHTHSTYWDQTGTVSDFDKIMIFKEIKFFLKTNSVRQKSEKMKLKSLHFFSDMFIHC